MATIVAVVAALLKPVMELGKCFYEPIKRELNYLCCFSDNVQNLRDEAKKLEDRRNDLQMRVEAEENNAQVILRTVNTWLEDATATQAEMVEIEDEITATQNGGFTLKPRYSLSKKGKKIAEAMKELRESCDFNIISHPPPPVASVPTPLGTYSEFKSRKHIEEGVMASLRDNETYKVGICGMGGVGKTTMAKKIMDRAREEHLFEEILMVVVSQSADPLRIQKSLAESLGLKLEVESLPARAHLLRNRLSESKKKSLIIVDDVWENLNLEEIGIVCNSRCKVLLTSRNRDVLKRMNAEKVHAVKVLSQKEAWDLFASHVSSCIEHQNLMSVAREVATECKGLPIALVTLGTALKDVGEARVWKDLLHQLKSNSPIGLPEFLKHVFKPLQLSYDRLENEEAQSLFLLCCLYPEDKDIPLERLAFYAKGLRMLRGIKSLEEARNRVYSLVEILKSRFLLLEGKNKDHVKMHDVVRDVAIFVASEKKLIACDSKTNDCTWISPYIGERIKLQAGSTIFPNLSLLWINCYSRYKVLEIDSQFFEGMKQLNVLSIKNSSLQQLPQTLVNLQTLVLEDCWSLRSISFVGELVNLEILICRECSSFESLPMEISRLRHLRLLQLSKCRKFKTIERGIISSLMGLEELIVEYAYDMRVVQSEWVNELVQLSSLSRLKININDSSFTTQQMTLPPNMVRYHIHIGNTGYFSNESMLYEKKMQLVLPENINMGNCIVKYVGSVEEIYLKGGDGSTLDFGVAQNIKILVLRDCLAVKKLVSMKTTAIIFPLLEVLELQQLSELKGICDVDGQIASNSLTNLKEIRLYNLPALEHLNVVSNFNKLSTIYVCKCGKLKSLFSSLMITRDSSLVQLKSLEIKSCDMMEQVFLWNNEETQIPQVFADLKSLKLQDLPKLTSFSKGIGSTEFPVLEKLYVRCCPLKNFAFTTSTEGDDVVHLFCEHDKIKLDSLRKLKFYRSDFKMGEIWCPQVPLNFFFPRLGELDLWGLKGLKSLFSLSIGESDCLSQLERLKIGQCDMIEEVILWNEEVINNHITLIFPKLKFLMLSDLPRLTSFSRGIESIEFPVLEKMEVRKCPMRTFASMESSTTCSNHDDDVIHLFCKSDKVKFGRLRKLKVLGFSGMKSLFSSSTIKSGCLSQLEELEISKCEMMEEVILWNEKENQTDIHITLFPKLKLLTLRSLPKLTSLSKGIQFTAPAEMRIWNCPLLESCASDDNDGYIHLFCKIHEVEFSSLKKLEISTYNGMSGYWCPQLPMIDIFSGLSKLGIFDIAGIKSLFTCSVAQNLQNMTCLQISWCKEMVGVIEDDACGGEIPPFHLFPNLEELQLDRLPKLKSFCEWRCALEFPLLKTLKIYDCGVMEKFTSGPLNTPVLEDIEIEYSMSLGGNDLNALLQQCRLKREEEEKIQVEGSSVEIKEEEGES